MSKSPCGAKGLRFCRRRGLMQEGQSGHLSSVPAVLLAPIAKRLRFAGAAAALLWAAYLALAAGQGSMTRLTATVGIVAFIGSAWVVGHSVMSRASAAQLRALGSVYSILIAFALALAGFSTPSATAPHGDVAWSAVWITLFPLLIPGHPRRILAETLVAAASSPLAYWLLVASTSRQAQSPLDLVLLFAPIFVAAVLAYTASRVLSGLGAQVANAADLGMYQLESQIALGGMGEVWRARHRLLSRPAAVKLIRAGQDDSRTMPGSTGSVAERRFEREAQVTAGLKSPHTVELYDFGVTDSGTIYYVMELLEGNDLEQLVKREGPFQPARVVHILEQALDSLAEAHQQGLVHRDIKPANLHVSHRGLERDFVKVLDFGLVKRSKRNPTDFSLSLETSVVGTPAYLSPEVITGEAPVDARADLYSLGCVAYYLLTGHLVFEAETAIAMAIAHATAKPVPPSRRTTRAIPPGLERIVMMCLEKSPERRPQNAMAMLRMLRDLDVTASEPQIDEHALLPGALELSHAAN